MKLPEMSIGGEKRASLYCRWKYMFSVSMTDRAKALLDNDGTGKGKAGWITAKERNRKRT